MAKLRYNRRTKRLQKGLRGTDACVLVRADKNLAVEALQQDATSRNNTLDVCSLPFAFPYGGRKQTHKRYALYNSFYCVFPPDRDKSTTTAAFQDQILRDYGAWLTKCKFKYALPVSVVEVLKKENRAFVYPDSTFAFNHFYIDNKFVCEGYVLSGKDDKEEDAATITMVYHRTQPIPKDENIFVDPNIFCLLESLGDTTTHSQVYNEWCEGDFAQKVSMAQLGANTDIQTVPLDKALYATLTCALKTVFFSQTEHINVYPQ